jgi:tetratricopeptide (TPR) repeat protein
MKTDHNQAIIKLEKLIAEQRTAKNEIELKETLTKLGTLFLALREAPKALTQFEEAISLAKAQDDEVNEARLYGVKGIALKQIGNDKQALQAFKKSRQIAERIGHRPITMDAETQIGKLEFEMGEPEKGIKNLEKAYRSAFETNDLQREMYIAGIMGNTFLAVEQDGKAMEFFSIALDVAKTLEKPQSESHYQILIGHIYLKKKDYGPAEEYFKYALDTGARLKNPQIEFAAFESLLQMSIHMKDPEQSLFNGEQTIQLARVIDDVGAEAENIKQLTRFLIEQGQYEAALPYLERGLELAAKVHDVEWQMDMLAWLGLAHYYLDELDQADDLLLKAYELATQMQKPVALAQISAKLGCVKADKGDIQEALKYSEEAILVARAQELPELEGEQLILQAMNYLDLGEPQEAKTLIEQGIDLYQRLARPDLIQNAEKLLEQVSGELSLNQEEHQ